MVHTALIGFGYWGPNLARNFSSLPHTHLSWICDLNPKLIKDVKKHYPTTKTTTNVHDVLSDKETQAIVIATPISTHVPLATQAMKAGKHVLVEKPLAPTVKEARALVRLARAQKRVLMVDHTYLYTPELEKIRDIITSGQLGNVFLVDSVRTNLGLIQKDSNVIDDLATHDFSILDFLFRISPTAISATGFSHEGVSQEAVAYVTAKYPKGLFFHTHVSWLSPVKIRTMIFVGTKKMLVYDDMEPSEKIKIYDKSILVKHDPHAQYQLRIGYRAGSMVAPHFPIKEGLAGMAEDFVRAVTTRKKPVSDGMMGARVVHAIEAATWSLRHGGKTVEL